MAESDDRARLTAEFLDVGMGRTAYSDDDLELAGRLLINWALDIAAMDPDLAVLLRHRTIERFVASGLPQYTPAGRGNIRSRLLRVSELLLDPDGRRVRLAPLPSANPLQPYSRQEVASMLSWAATQSSEGRARSANVLLALGLGAGLSASELSEARERDLAIDSDGATLTVTGARPRVVPLIHRWSEHLIETLAGAHDPAGDTYLFRPQRSSSWANVVSTFVSQRYSGVRAQTQRMRATWIVEQLNAGTHVRVLTEAAGVDSLEAFTRYLRFVRPPAPADAAQQLRRLPHAPPRA